jgi:leucyl-tRNA synthetase
MAVPAHDQRDLDFARAFDLPVRVVLDTNASVTGAVPVVGDGEMSDDLPLLDPKTTGKALTGDGRLINSGPLDGLSKVTAIKRTTEQLETAGSGRAAKNYRLRDWLISRQRYWGTPIPIIHGENGEEIPVPEDQLPVLLPPTEGLNLQPKGTSPLGAAEMGRRCQSARWNARQTRADTMDTFVDSSGIFCASVTTRPAERSIRDRLITVPYRSVCWRRDPILHLLMRGSSRRCCLPWISLVHRAVQRAAESGHGAHGGSAMSGRRANVRLSDQLDEHGVDAIRLPWFGPPEDDGRMFPPVRLLPVPGVSNDDE